MAWVDVNFKTFPELRFAAKKVSGLKSEQGLPHSCTFALKISA